MKKFLAVVAVWVVSALVFMGFAAILMEPLEEEKESIYSLYLPEVSATPTLAERQELIYRWFHRENVEEIKRDHFEKFKAVEFVFYDFDLDVNVGNADLVGFEINYLGLAKDGKIYHTTSGDQWYEPYYTSAFTLQGDKLHLTLKRNDRMVVWYLGIAAFAGAIPAMIAAMPLFALSTGSQKKSHSRVV